MGSVVVSMVVASCGIQVVTMLHGTAIKRLARRILSHRKGAIRNNRTQTVQNLFVKRNRDPMYRTIHGT